MGSACTINPGLMDYHHAKRGKKLQLKLARNLIFNGCIDVVQAKQHTMTDLTSNKCHHHW